MVDVLLILWDTPYFDGWRTIDTLRYYVFRWLTYCWHFDYTKYFHVLLILWDTTYFDDLCTVDTLIYSVFLWLTYCWYFEILRILMVGVLLILLDTTFFLWSTYCWYFEILRILMVDVLLILLGSTYFDGWRTEDGRVFLRLYLVFSESSYCLY